MKGKLPSLAVKKKIGRKSTSLEKGRRERGMSLLLGDGRTLRVALGGKSAKNRGGEVALTLRRGS